MKYSMVAN